MEQDGTCHPRYRSPGGDAGWSRMGRMGVFVVVAILDGAVPAAGAETARRDGS